MLIGTTQTKGEQMATIKYTDPNRPMPTDYRPYDQLPAFDEGIDDYMSGRYSNPYDSKPREGVNAQAWDRGSEYAMRVVRYSQAEAKRYEWGSDETIGLD
jgi:hypothetical protein